MPDAILGVQIGDIRRSCPWCDALNLVRRAGANLVPVWCGQCGHRGDVARLLCDCASCLAAQANIRKERGL